VENHALPREDETLMSDDTAAHGEEMVDGATASHVEAARRLWPGVLVWAAVCVGYLVSEAAGLADGLATPVPLIAALVIARVVDARPTARRLARRAAYLFVVTGLGLGGLVLAYRLKSPLAASPIELAALVLASTATIGVSLVRRARAALLRPLGLEPGSAVHIVVAIAAVATIVSSAVGYVQLQSEAAETVPLYPSDSLVSMMSDAALALSGIGFLLTRGPRQARTRLGLRPVRPRQVAVAVALAGGFLVVVGVMEHAESVWLPQMHEREDRFDYEFVGSSPVTGAVLMAVAAGVGEELVFRGALQPRLGVLATSVLFAALHVQYQLPGIVMIFVVALGLGLLKERTSTTFTICVHVAYDVGAFLLPDF
jgi:CAAX protease family protein